MRSLNLVDLIEIRKDSELLYHDVGFMHEGEIPKLNSLKFSFFWSIPHPQELKHNEDDTIHYQCFQTMKMLKKFA